jgi:hypothetical protein
MRPKGSGAKDVHMNEGVRDPRLRWYPRSWRSRYGEELVALLDDEYGGRLPTLVYLGLVTGGLRQRARHAGLSGDSQAAVNSVRAGTLVVLAAWTAFVVAGASFAKFSEHFDEALPHSIGAHRVPDFAFTVLQAVAGVAGVLVIAGTLVAVPTFVRFLRVDGWARIRGHFLRALACTALTGAVTVPVLLDAHHLTPHQRDGGIHWYGGLFLIWVALIVITLALWTVVAVAAGRRLELPPAMITVEAMLAAVVAVAMLVMIGATAVWWVAMAKDAPAFLSASPGGAPRSSWDIWFIATVTLMAVATGTAAVGAVREVSAWAKTRGGEQSCC